MTLTDFKTLLLTCDPAVSKFTGPGTGNYTVWVPGTRTDGLMSDDQSEEDDTRVYVDRFTKVDNDTVAALLKTKLDESFIPYEYEQMFETDTGYIHHSFTCIVG